jgi:hypothetical protein
MRYLAIALPDTLPATRLLAVPGDHHGWADGRRTGLCPVRPSVIARLSCPQRGHRLAPGLLKRGIRGRRTGRGRAHEQIISLGNQRFVTPKEFAQPPFHPVPYHCNTDSLSHREPETSDALSPAVCIHGEVTGAQPPAVPVAAGEVGWSRESLMPAQVLVHAVSDG